MRYLDDKISKMAIFVNFPENHIKIVNLNKFIIQTLVAQIKKLFQTTSLDITAVFTYYILHLTV